MIITDEQIKEAKANTRYTLEPHHMHNGNIRAAYQWLDAQPKLTGAAKKRLALKHTIQKWAGFYVSQSDVEVAAYLHPDIFGVYPRYNISDSFVHPADCRLVGLIQRRTKRGFRRYEYRTYFERPNPNTKRIAVGCP
jgi:hypothetical protein